MIHKIKILLAVGFVAALFLPVSCKDLLNQLPTTEMPISEFWKTEDDAVYALQGAYTHIRNLFNRGKRKMTPSMPCRALIPMSGTFSTATII